MADMKHVRGLDGLLDTLKRLPPEIVSKGGGSVRASLRDAGVIFRDATVANVQAMVAEPNKGGYPYESTKTLEQALVVVRRKPRGFRGEQYQLRIKRGSKYPDGTPVVKVGAVLEFGDERVSAKANMRRGFEGSKGEALSAFTNGLRRRIDSAIRRARKRGLIS